MPHPLETRLAAIRRELRHVLLTYGLSWVAAVVIGSVLTVCCIDWLVHLDDPGVRLILGLGILGGSSWVMYRYLWGPLRTRFPDIELALRIEKRYPGFNDSLASTIQFLQGQADPAVGSPALQRAVISRTLGQVEQIEFNDVIETTGVRRVATVAVCVCVLTGVIVGLNQPETAIALERLLFPFSAPSWPRKTDLRVLNAELEPIEFDADDPIRIARGDTLKLFVENAAGRLPSKVHLEYRFADAKVVSEPLRATTLRDRHGEARELASGQLVANKGPLWFRAVGGDDIGDWYELLVIPPPVVDRLHVVLTPPAYIQRPVERLPEGVGHVQGLIGTQVSIEAHVSKPLRSASVRVREQERYPAELAQGGQQFKATFVIKESGIYSYWFDLQDLQGFENNEASRYEVRGIQDLVPDIYIDVPASDLQATPDAVLSIRTVAKDDLGLKSMRLIHRIGLEPAPVDKTAGTGTPPGTELFDGSGRPLQQSVDYKWDLAPLSLEPGARVVFHTEATDDYDVALGPPAHIGRSVSRTVSIVSREQKHQEIADRQGGLLDDLERAFKFQDQARSQVGELQLQLEKAGNLRAQDVDALQRVELSQRQIAAQLAGTGDALEQRARALLEEIRDNKLDDPETERRITRMADELKRLGEGSLPAIEQDLTQARKLAQAGAESETPTRDKTRPTRGTGCTSDDRPTGKPAGDQPPADAPAADEPAAREPGAEQPQPDEKPGSETPAPRPDAADPEASKPGQTKPTPQDQQSARAAGRSAPSRHKPVDQAGALKQVAENQSAVLESLSDMLKQLSEWRDQRTTVQDLKEILDGQREVNQQTAELGKQTLTKGRDELTPQDRADLARLAERQQKQAENFEQLSAKMQELIDKSKADDPDGAATLEDALTQARQDAIAGRMREATGQINTNKMGAAAENQQQILDKLKEMDDIVRNQQDTDLETLVKKLKASEQALTDLQQRQSELLRKVRKAEQLADPVERQAELQRLRKEQQALQEEVAKEARRLQRLQARRPGKAAGRGAARLQQAQAKMDQDDAAGAAQDQEDALDALEQARRELAGDRKTAEEQLAREQLEKIADELKVMISLEQSLIDQTRRLHHLRTAGGTLTRPQLATLRQLADTQRSLKDDTDRLVETLTAAEVFALALKGAARNMQQAADLLNERNTGEQTQKAENAARQRFVDLIDALKPEKPKKARQGEGGGEGGPRPGPDTDGIPLLAELKMLKTMQTELNERTLELAASRDAGGQLTPAQEQEAEAVAREQGALADLARNLSRLAAQAGGDDDEAAEDAAPEEMDDDLRSRRKPAADPGSDDEADSEKESGSGKVDDSETKEGDSP